ncbi:M20 family metallopeptidase [Geoalkalibacter halelectricus]|uniref:M20/M25/M40 family metallo-hydrolase n=1 Tax=Geoalkalibacter halelectricus TaxID=2847045 RepID=A0ABY5ZNG9_9BACT|nr:M20/M25/M40 family metallo-hydrolase [Geoalkalibacter halelectricus]MDO3378404.1 M20/M25/M40 family metallo-hydrolase [Geoalkalibacter halelectricus]UWZ80276.1 M20/M25/M40 family metallo-hydrolase [Geoalkalibacter halelectricus]
MPLNLEDLWKAVDPERLRRLLVEMVDIYSPSGKEEDIQLFLEEQLHGAGFAVRRQEVEEERYNLVVPLGWREPRLYLVGHVDTIAAWDLEDYGARDAQGLIHGLGSADMKGGCAAMVETFLALATALPPEQRPPVGLLLVVGEEENGDGSATFLESTRPPWVVIGEPTGLNPCFAHYGYLEAGFVTSGRRTHSSLPELGHNAVESMLRVLLHLGRDPLFERSSSEIAYSIRELTSSRAGFVVPDRCEAWIDLHLPPTGDPAEVEAAIRARAETAERLIPDLDLELQFNFAARGYDLGTNNPLARTLAALYPELGLKGGTDAFRSHSDGNLFFEAGVKPLILGPGALEVAHTPDEHTPFAEVLAAAKIYAALCMQADSL